MMTDVRYRRADPGDLPSIVDVLLTTLPDMHNRHGVAVPIAPREMIETAYGHIMRTGFFHVAEKDRRIISIAGAIVRDDLWYLASFWTLPEFQRQGIGGPLLDLVWRDGTKAGAEKFFTWSSVDIPAMAAYMRRGMLPGYQIFSFRGKPRELSPIPSSYDVRPLEKSVAMELDREIRGTPREPDHAFWLSQDGSVGRAVHRGERIAGYYYVTKAGVGPISWKETRDAESMLTIACREAAEHNDGEVTISVPGLNHDALRFALRTGLQIVTNAHLLTTKPFGSMDRYIASGPALF